MVENNGEKKMSLPGFERQVNKFLDEQGEDHGAWLVESISKQNISDLLSSSPHNAAILLRLEKRLQEDSGTASGSLEDIGIMHLKKTLLELVKEFHTHLSQHKVSVEQYLYSEIGSKRFKLDKATYIGVCRSICDSLIVTNRIAKQNYEMVWDYVNSYIPSDSGQKIPVFKHMLISYIMNKYFIKGGLVVREVAYTNIKEGVTAFRKQLRETPEMIATDSVLMETYGTDIDTYIQKNADPGAVLASVGEFVERERESSETEYKRELITIKKKPVSEERVEDPVLPPKKPSKITIHKIDAGSKKIIHSAGGGSSTKTPIIIKKTLPDEDTPEELSSVEQIFDDIQISTAIPKFTHKQSPEYSEQYAAFVEMIEKHFEKLSDGEYQMRGVTTTIKPTGKNSARKVRGERVGLYKIQNVDYKGNQYIAVHTDGRVTALEANEDGINREVVIDNVTWSKPIVLDTLDQYETSEIILGVQQFINRYITAVDAPSIIKQKLLDLEGVVSPDELKMLAEIVAIREAYHPGVVSGAELLLCVPTTQWEPLLDAYSKSDKEVSEDDFASLLFGLSGESLDEKVDSSEHSEKVGRISATIEDTSKDVEPISYEWTKLPLHAYRTDPDYLYSVFDLVYAALQSSIADPETGINPKTIEWVEQLKKFGLGNLAYLKQQNFFASVLPDALVADLETLYNNVSEYRTNESLNIATSNKDLSRNIIKTLLDDWSDVYGSSGLSREYWESIMAVLRDNETEASEYRRLALEIFAVEATDSFDPATFGEKVLYRYFHQQYERRMTETGIYRYNPSDLTADAIDKLNQTFDYQVAQKIEPWMLSHKQYLRLNESYQNLLAKEDEIESPRKRFLITTKKNLLGVFLGTKRLLERVNKDTDGGQQELVEAKLLEGEGRKLYGDFTTDEKNDPLLKSAGIASAKVQADNHGKIAATIALTQYSKDGGKTVRGKDKLLSVSIPDTHLYHTDDIVKQILDPKRADLNDQEKVSALWGFLKARIGSVYEKYGTIRGDRMDQHVIIGVGSQGLQVMLNNKNFINESGLWPLSLDQRLSQIMQVYQIFKAIVDSHAERTLDVLEQPATQQLSLGRKAQRRLRTELRKQNDTKTLPGVYVEETDDADVDKLDPLTNKNISLNYFVFPAEAVSPKQKRTVYADGVLYTIEGTNASPQIVEQHGSAAEWLDSFSLTERSMKLQEYSQELLKQYLSIGSETRRKLIFSYFGEWYVASLSGEGSLSVKYIANPTSQLDTVASSLPSPERSLIKKENQPYFDPTSHKYILGYQHEQLPIQVLSVDDRYKITRKKATVMRSSNHPEFVPVGDAGKQLTHCSMLGDIEFVDTLIATIDRRLQNV